MGEWPARASARAGHSRFRVCLSCVVRSSSVPSDAPLGLEAHHGDMLIMSSGVEVAVDRGWHRLSEAAGRGARAVRRRRRWAGRGTGRAGGLHDRRERASVRHGRDGVPTGHQRVRDDAVVLSPSGRPFPLSFGRLRRTGDGERGVDGFGSGPAVRCCAPRRRPAARAPAARGPSPAPAAFAGEAPRRDLLVARRSSGRGPPPCRPPGRWRGRPG